MKNILLVGSSGQLGSDLSQKLNKKPDYQVSKLDHYQIELTDKDSVFSSITTLSPDIVINCGAYVRVDDCEDNAAHAIEVNALGAGYVAQATEEVGAVCVYISTDYVFDGQKNSPYLENDPAYPINIYGISKLSGEHMVRSYSTKNFIIRSSGLYGLAGSSGKGGNFVNTIIKGAKEGKPLNVVDDQVLSPTFTKDLSKAITDLMETSKFGIYHITNSGECSWFEFAKQVLSITGLSTELNCISTEQYGAKARRPAYSVLSNSKLENLGLNMLRPWDQALENYISLLT
ncbi:MAG: NAD(P)-dependent oxidoreductase [Thermodesulfobacteriota bacterium]|nr:MAG: NAD(P)-dependent oxidoreductase [Thermodesulfobacteriota bacterium]